MKFGILECVLHQQIDVIHSANRSVKSKDRLSIYYGRMLFKGAEHENKR
jgi:hypothetical protein